MSSIILLSLACELYLKALILKYENYDKETKTMERIHNLYKLFTLLDKDVQMKIILDTYKQKEELEKIYNDAIEYIRQINDYFEYYRYYYEKKMIKKFILFS